ncbi:MAG TPA: molybdenum cofactor guanylyltransferase, partial [Cyclobacteriaceae bacterium]
MIGVVLCGGKSSRMGSDKGLLKDGDKTWSQMAIEKLSSLSLHSVVSINSSQKNTYSPFFSSDQLVLDKEELDIRGPLLGLLSVHDQFASDDLFILGCDLPKMEIHVLQSLLDEHKQFPHFDCFVFSNSTHNEPLCGVYTANGLKKISDAVGEGKLRSNRMMDVLDQLNTKRLPLKEEWSGSFQNM